MKSKDRLHQEDDGKEGVYYHNIPAFQGLYFLIVLQAHAMRPNKQKLSVTRGEKKTSFILRTRAGFANTVR